ncbi:MAG: serine hydrolase domain-containing protein, partial [Bacteroidota bacterium]
EPIATEPAGIVRQLMAPHDGDDRPGGVLAIIRGGEVDFVDAYGMADLTHGVPITRETVFNIGSVSKQFAGIFFAMKAVNDTLDLDGDVRAYMPELPDFGPTVTLRHLLNHTSGYREAYGVLALDGRQATGDILTRRDAIDAVRNQTALQFEPGTRHLYNSTAYVLLTEIAERITDQPYPDWMDDNVFAPLEMTSTTIEREPGEVIPDAAFSYTLTERGTYREDFEAYDYYGATDVYTTVDDLAHWMRNYATGELGGPEVIPQLVEKSVLANGDTLNYALGITRDQHLGRTRYIHGGATGGYRALMMYYPELDAGLVLLANTGLLSLGRIGLTAAEAFFGTAETGAETPEPAPVTVNAEKLDAYAGSYFGSGLGLFTFTANEAGGLSYRTNTGRSGELTALSDTEFELSPGQSFTFSATGETITYDLGTTGTAQLRRVEPAPRTLDLSPYAGTYYSPEAEARFTIEFENNRLIVRHRRYDPFPLRVLGEDLFRGQFPLTEVVFTRDAAGKISGFTTSSGRMLDVPFERLED